MTACSILLVDDDALARLTLATFLDDAGMDVMEADCGDAAARLIRQGVEPDILVTDVQMPGRLDGIALADFARERMPWLPVLFVSGWAALFEPSGRYGVRDAYLRKPCRPEDVVEKIGRLLDGRHQRQPVLIAGGHATSSR